MNVSVSLTVTVPPEVVVLSTVPVLVVVEDSPVLAVVTPVAVNEVEELNEEVVE